MLSTNRSKDSAKSVWSGSGTVAITNRTAAAFVPRSTVTGLAGLPKNVSIAHCRGLPSSETQDVPLLLRFGTGFGLGFPAGRRLAAACCVGEASDGGV